MTSRIVPAVFTPGDRAFTITVPGNERWTIKSVCAIAARGNVVDADRGYLLSISASGYVLGAVGATDPGSGIGTATVTWSDAPASSAVFQTDGYAVAPFAAVLLDPGYVLVGQITHSHGGDGFNIVTAWIDYIPS